MTISIKSVKVIAIASFSAMMILAFSFGESAVTVGHAEIPGAPSRRTGAPGESNCTSCHNSNTQTGQANIIAPATYVPGQTYTIQIQNTTNTIQAPHAEPRQTDRSGHFLHRLRRENRYQRLRRSVFLASRVSVG